MTYSTDSGSTDPVKLNWFNLSRTLLGPLQMVSKIDLILLDFSKAFDKVNHPKLLHKLQMHGVQGKTLSWIQSFLVGRTQSVVLEGGCSDEVPVSSGVPQGSILGPILFLLYINDLFNNVQSQVRLFADDTTVYLTINHPSDASSLQKDLDLLQRWEVKWDMEFNPSKCLVLHITRTRAPIKTSYTMHSQTLDNLSAARYLVVDLSTNMNFNFGCFWGQDMGSDCISSWSLLIFLLLIPTLTELPQMQISH